MNRFLIIASIAAVTLGMAFVAYPDGAAALLMAILISLAFIAAFRYFAIEKDFVTNVFLAALLIRLVFGIIVHVFDLRDFFGGDANTYDFRGAKLVDFWAGIAPPDDPKVIIASTTTGPGWGMNYLVAFLYTLFGKNIFLAQSFCAVFGAATAP